MEDKTTSQPEHVENEKSKSLEIQNNFKRILEYFVKHMNYVCSKKPEVSVADNTPKFEDGIKRKSGWRDSGKGYKNDGIQKFMEEYAKLTDNNSFSMEPSGLGRQKICISIDFTDGYKKGSYLHLVTRDEKKKITNETAGTNINPLFKEKEKEEKGENDKPYEFWGLEVGPSQNSPTYVFPPLQYSFGELGLGKDWDDMTKEQKFNLQTFFHYFIEMRKAELMGPLTYKGKEQLLATHNMILTGAPGTGKTWSAKNIASWMINKKPYQDLSDDEKATMFGEKGHCKIVQFHPSYDYTDFVEGLRPTTKDKSDNKEDNQNSMSIGFERVDGVFKDFCKKALGKEQPGQQEDSEEKPYVFIIDEINRGELSKIFGELFYSIDPGYRGPDGRVQTQYQNMLSGTDVFKDGFYVPDNVYIIGTMNDIDRSVESMDFAMRRRFSFIEVKANEREDMWTEDWKDLAKACMEAINTEIEQIPGLSSAYHIGPAYFKKLNDYEPKDYPDFFKLWDNHLQGVIFEYLRGKKDAEKTIAEIQDKYLKALKKAINQRLNLGGLWGKMLKDLQAEAKANEIDSSILDEDTLKEYLKQLQEKNNKVVNISPENRSEDILKLQNQFKHIMLIGNKIIDLHKGIETNNADISKESSPDNSPNQCNS